MLVLHRREGSWVTVTHAASGDTMRIKVFGLSADRVTLAFEDNEHIFQIEREERSRPPRP